MRRATLRFVGWTTANALVTLVVWRRSEFVFLAHYSTDVEIALYSIAFATVAAIAAVPERLSEVLVSAFATLRGADATERIRTGFSRSLRLLVMATLPLTAGVAAVGPELLRLVYGDEYREAGDVLLAVVAVIPFLAVSSISVSFLSGLGDARTPLVAGLFAAVVNIALAFVLVPRYDALGAGLANAGAQVAATAALYAAARRVSGPVDWRPGSLVRVALAAAGCALASVGVLSVLGGPGGLVLAVAAGAISVHGDGARAALAVRRRRRLARRALRPPPGWPCGRAGAARGGAVTLPVTVVIPAYRATRDARPRRGQRARPGAGAAGRDPRRRRRLAGRHGGAGARVRRDRARPRAQPRPRRGAQHGRRGRDAAVARVPGRRRRVAAAPPRDAVAAARGPRPGRGIGDRLGPRQAARPLPRTGAQPREHAPVAGRAAGHENYIAISAALARTDAVRDAGGFRPYAAVEDLDLWARLLTAGSAVVVPAVTIVYYVHPGQMSADTQRRAEPRTCA